MTWRRSSTARASLAAVALLGASLIPAPQSIAGTYHVYACRIPYGPQAGNPAPVQLASGEGEEAGRWSHQVSGAAQYGELCASQGSIAAALQSGVTHSKSDLSVWQFTAPAEEVIDHAIVWRAGDADGGAGYLFWLAAPQDPLANEALTSEDVFDGCAYTGGCTTGIGDTAEPLATANKVQVPAANLGGSHLYINASCSSASCPSSGGDEQGHAVVVYVYATDITLEQQSAPTVSGVSGELATGSSLSGTASLDFHADDSGAGVYRALISVDGAVLESPLIEETEACKEVSVPAEDRPAFLSAQPCPASANGHVSLDTTKLSNGPHRLHVEVTNAAGNATTVIERTIEVSNTTLTGGAQQGTGALTAAFTPQAMSLAAGQSNGVPASSHATIAAHWVAGHRARLGGMRGVRLTCGFGQPQTIAGRLIGPGGTPIADAEIAVSARKSYGGAAAQALASARTDRQGRFIVHLSRRSASERLRLSYSPTLGGSPVASQGLQLIVRAGVALHVTPSVVSAGQTIALQGRVLGGPIPPGGKQVVLEARSSGSPWLQFLVLRSGRSGRFQGRHRFRLPGPIHYRFRAVCPQEADFPFAAGTSRSRSVWER